MPEERERCSRRDCGEASGSSLAMLVRGHKARCAVRNSRPPKPSSGRPEFDGPLTKKCSPCEEPERCHTGRKRRSATFDYPAPILHTSCLTVASELWRTRKARDRSAVGVATLGCHYAVVLEKLPPQQIATASARPLRVAYFVDAEDCSDACLDAVFAETYKHAC